MRVIPPALMSLAQIARIVNTFARFYSGLVIMYKFVRRYISYIWTLHRVSEI